jgi:hypothetical protein
MMNDGIGEAQRTIALFFPRHAIEHVLGYTGQTIFNIDESWQIRRLHPCQSSFLSSAGRPSTEAPDPRDFPNQDKLSYNGKKYATKNAVLALESLWYEACSFLIGFS